MTKRKLQEYEIKEESDLQYKNMKCELIKEQSSNIQQGEQFQNNQNNSSSSNNSDSDNDGGIIPVRIRLDAKFSDVRGFGDCVLVNMSSYGKVGDQGRKVAEEISEVLSEYFQDSQDVVVTLNREPERSEYLENLEKRKRDLIETTSELLGVEQQQISELQNSSKTFFRQNIDTVKAKYYRLTEYLKLSDDWELDWQRYALSVKLFLLTLPLKRIAQLKFVFEKSFLKQVQDTLYNVVRSMIEKQHPEFNDWWEDYQQQLLL
eukprot:TRINITY_DN4940_c0_g1_i1.p1 TRINITY_DN4940_c0_g1~~TRINITY_DN4940_c0_g1_i1.p1  ORF type:complete len:262 (-),score=37.15 TRINITY_DN4940_c0_g1_i1:118-903(-)